MGMGMAKYYGMRALLLAAGALLVTTGAQAGVVLSNWTFTKAFGAASIPLNGSTSLTFSITNGAALPTSNIAFTDNFPPGLVVATPNGGVGDCGVGSVVTAAPGGGSVSLANGALAAAGSCNFSVNVTGTSAGLKNNTTLSLTSSRLPHAPGASATLTVLAAAAAAASIPTLSEWGLILLVLAMAASAFKAMRSKR